MLEPSSRIYCGLIPCFRIFNDVFKKADYEITIFCYGKNKMWKVVLSSFCSFKKYFFFIVLSNALTVLGDFVINASSQHIVKKQKRALHSFIEEHACRKTNSGDVHHTELKLGHEHSFFWLRQLNHFEFCLRDLRKQKLYEDGLPIFHHIYWLNVRVLYNFCNYWIL